MKKYVYELVEGNLGLTSIKRTDENGQESWIPSDPANSDYQAYLKHLTENPTEDVE